MEFMQVNKIKNQNIPKNPKKLKNYLNFIKIGYQIFKKKKSDILRLFMKLKVISKPS